jgi:hypothetical protein
MNLRIRHVGRGLLTILLMFLVAEVSLHASAALSTRVNELLSQIEPHIPDARLGAGGPEPHGYRPAPSVLEHDANGWRNIAVAAHADIVTLGDSHTYGLGVPAADAWPRRLQDIIGKTVYNMAFNGYGPVDSLILWDEAQALRPSVVLEGFYSGNDLYDVFARVHYGRQVPDLMAADRVSREAVRSSEAGQLLKERIEPLFSRCIKPSGRAWAPYRMLKQYSKAFALVRRLKYEAEQFFPQGEWEQAKKLAQRDSLCYEVFDDGKARTLFAPAYRASAMDLDDVGIREGLRISLEALRRMDALARANHIRFVVVLIPTKEMVFAESAEMSASQTYKKAIRNEVMVWTMIRAFLDANGIEYVEPLARLRKELAEGNQPYPLSLDGHPNAAGHAVIAAAVNDKLNEAKRMH